MIENAPQENRIVSLEAQGHPVPDVDSYRKESFVTCDPFEVERRVGVVYQELSDLLGCRLSERIRQCEKILLEDFGSSDPHEDP